MTDNTERAQVGWGFWLWWVLASIAGLGVCALVTLPMLYFIGASSQGMEDLGWAGAGVVFEIVVGAVFGASVGIAQWSVLRRQVARAGWWVLASSMGLAVGVGVADVVYPVIDLSGAGGGAVIGASVGIAQWSVLRRQVARAGWWVLASSMGLAVGFGMADVVPAIYLVGAGGGAVFYLAFTGSVLVWLLLQPVTEEPSLPQDAT